MNFLLKIFEQNGEKMVENSTNQDRYRPGESHLPMNNPGIFKNKVIGIGYNEITKENFTVQTQKLATKILTLKPDCYNENNGWFSKSKYKIGENFNHFAHEELYHYLYRKNIITVKLHTLENFFMLNAFNRGNIYVINKDLIKKTPVDTEQTPVEREKHLEETAKTLRAIINPSNKDEPQVYPQDYPQDYPQLLTCYDINYEELSKFLIDYKYSPIDVIPIGPFGGRKQPRNKTRRKQKTKQKTKKRSIKRMKRRRA
jgi:hypothetical protein